MLGSKACEMNLPWAIAAHEDGRMFITDHGNNRVQVFNELGIFISEFGSKGSKDGQFFGPTGIALDQNGNVFVSDWENHRVQQFNQNGTFLGKFGSKGKFNKIFLRYISKTIRNVLLIIKDFIIITMVLLL